MANWQQISQLRRRVRARGMTLIEIMIVVAIIAMVMGAVAVVAIPKMKEAQISTCKSAVRTVRSAVQQWQLSNNDYSSCPTVSQLVQDKQLDAGQATTDPWGGDFAIKCEGEDVVVSSNGPDKKPDSPDDIVIPQLAQPTE
jgi:general secretion pathway protein G